MYRYINGQIRANGRTTPATWSYDDIQIGNPTWRHRDAPPMPKLERNGHPLLIIGIILGAIFGLIMACPPAMRGWVIMIMIGLVVWFGWTVNRDQQTRAAEAAYVFPEDAPPMPSPTVEVRRAQLVKLPRK